MSVNNVDLDVHGKEEPLDSGAERPDALKRGRLKVLGFLMSLTCPQSTLGEK